MKVFINDKPSAVIVGSVSDAQNLLPASMVKRVEVIITPGSKYDAEGCLHYKYNNQESSRRIKYFRKPFSRLIRKWQFNSRRRFKFAKVFNQPVPNVELLQK